MNIAIFSPSQNPYSETFIQAHKEYLTGSIFYYYGSKSNMQLEGCKRMVTKLTELKLRAERKLKNQTNSFLHDQLILSSLKKNKISVILVEYGMHAHHLRTVLIQSQIPFVVHFHGYDASNLEVIESCDNYNIIFQEAKSIISVSKKMHHDLLALGCPKDKLLYNVYGPRPEFEDIIPQFKNKEFLAIGRFTEKKAPHNTILAFNQILDKHPDAKLLMAGEGELMFKCEALVKELGIEDNVLFLGIITPKVFMNLLSKSLAFVQHSITALNGDMEGTPLAVLEASAAGLPVISTFHAGIPDVVIDGKTGLLCHEHDINKMADNMLICLENLSFAKILGSNGKLHIKTNYNLKQHIGQLQKILENVS